MDERGKQNSFHQEQEPTPHQRFFDALSSLVQESKILTDREFPTLLGDLDILCRRYQQQGIKEAEEISDRIRIFRENSLQWPIEERVPQFKDLLEGIKSTFLESR